MGKNRINSNQVKEDAISAQMKPEVLNAMTEESQKTAINTVREVYNKERDGGILGKLLGTNKVNVSMHITLIICVSLIVLGFFISDKDVWDKILTLIAASVGYIFGANQKG